MVIVFLIIEYLVLGLIFVAVPACLVFIQIRARLLWRLVSVVLAIVGYSWFFYFNTGMTWAAKTGNYERGNNEFVSAIDEMNLQGHTNAVHQACQEYQNTFWLEDNSSNFDEMVSRTEDRAFNMKPETNSQNGSK